MFWMLYICSVETLFKNLKNLVWRYLNLSNRLMVFFGLILDFCLVMIWNVSICPEEAMFKICLKLVDFEGIKNQFKVLSYIWSYFWSLWASWTFLTGAGVKECWHCCRLGGCLIFLIGTDVLEWGYVLQAPLSLGFKFCEGLMARSWDMKLKLVWFHLVGSFV